MTRPDYNKQEKVEAKRDGAVLVKNSGRGDEKGDAKLDVGDWRFLVDYKHYDNTFSVSKTAWKKLKLDAWNSKHRSPLIKLVYNDTNTELAIIEWEIFKAMLEELEEYRKQEEGLS